MPYDGWPVCDRGYRHSTRTGFNDMLINQWFGHKSMSYLRVQLGSVANRHYLLHLTHLR